MVNKSNKRESTNQVIPPAIENGESSAALNLSAQNEIILKKLQRLETLDEIVREIKELKDMLKEKDERIKVLERRVEDLEQYTRREDVIITGLTIDRKFAEVANTAVDGGGVKVDWNGEIEKQVLAKLKERKIHVDSEEISACHTLGKPDVNGQQKVILRFVSRKTKVRVMNEWEKLRGTGIYINEHLTKKNADIAKAARD